MTNLDSDASGPAGAALKVVQRRRGTALLAAIHEATLAELADVGLKGLTMEGIAARAGAGKASLYRRWASTEDLVLAALAATDASFAGEVEHWRTMTPFDLRDALVEVLRHFASGLDTPNGRALQMLLSWRHQHPELVERVRAVMVTPRAAVLRAVLERAVTEGTIAERAVTPTVVSAGPRLVIAQHKETGQVQDADVEALVDELLLPALQSRSI